jgi:hypothetical protein
MAAMDNHDRGFEEVAMVRVTASFTCPPDVLRSIAGLNTRFPAVARLVRPIVAALVAAVAASPASAQTFREDFWVTNGPGAVRRHFGGRRLRGRELRFRRATGRRVRSRAGAQSTSGKILLVR